MITLDDIRAAQQRIRGVAVRTPLVECPRERADERVFFKAESLQPVGAFKIRGAYNKVASLPEAERKRGVITYSSGNHAQAVGYAARAFGTRAVIVMPSNAPPIKQQATAALGAEIVLVGAASSERQAKAEELAARHGYTMVPPYDDPWIVAGQGTCGLEIVEDLPDVELVLAPISGGGLLSGIATAVKLSKPDVKVVGVEPELAGDAQESFRSGKVVEWPAEKTSRTIADGLRTQSVGKLPFEHIQRYADDIITVTEDEIREAMRRIALNARLVAEPSGAVSFAGFLFHREQLPKSSHTVAVISGGNVDPLLLARVLAG
ncbi:MAG TPA: threonine/serine dehydratase [Terriglobales bacterium]|nr:threonine/serine dehydratase [Terriglobales bacterium]